MSGSKTQPTTPETPPAVADASAQQAPQEPSVAEQMALFLARMEARQSRFETAIEARFQAMEEKLEDAAAASPVAAAHAAAGLIPPPAPSAPTYAPIQASQADLEAAANAQRLVAFIPKDDPLNIKSKTLDTWINGVLIRCVRGEVAMMALGHAADLAKGGHGHVVDLVAMQSVMVQHNPDYSTPEDQFPTSYSPTIESSVPREFYGQVVH